MQVDYQNRERQQKDTHQKKPPCKKTIQELLESEAKFRSLVEATSDWIWQVDHKGFFTYVSPKIKDVLGYEPEDVLGKTPYTLMPEKEVTKVKKQFLKIAKNKRPFFNLENWNLTKNGQLVLLETSGVPIYDVNGKMVGYRGINRDITERKKIEATLKESEQLYRTLFDNSDDGFLLVEPIFGKDGLCDFKILKLNKSYERQTGVKASNILGKKASDAIPGLEDKHFSIICKVAKTAKPLHVEEFYKESDKWYDSYYFPYTEGKVGVLFRDITERKKAEAALRDSEEKYRVYVESSPVAFFVINKKQQYIMVNDRACKLLDYPRQELLKMTIFDIVFKEDLDLTREQYAELQKYGKSIREFRLKRKDNQPVYVILNVMMLSDGRAMAFCEDITERKKLEKRLQINERLAAIGATASMVGHDIRNPLQAMVSDIFLLKSELADAPLGDSVIENLTDLEDNILYINKIVADLQDYSRRLNPEFNIIELSEVICNVLSNITVPENVALSVNVTGLPSIRTDPALIQRVLTNLINNSIQAMPDGGNLTITGSIKQEKLYITVADTGVGIPEEIQAKLFQPMFTTKAKGQGLGLAVAKRLVNALNGTIKFESKKDIGTKFTIELPLVP